MRKKSNSVVTHEAPAATLEPLSYVVTFDAVAWLPRSIELYDVCGDADQAREELHRLLDHAIKHIEPRKRRR